MSDDKPMRGRGFVKIGRRGKPIGPLSPQERLIEIANARHNNLANVRRQRDVAVALAHREGATTREIGAALGISHTAVAKIVRKVSDSFRDLAEQVTYESDDLL